MSAALTVVGFFAAVALIAFASHLVWQHTIASMPTPPHWYEAFRLIWCDVYGMDWGKRPRVIFVRGESFGCLLGGKVLAATGKSDYNSVTVAVPDESTPISATAFAHELYHQARAKRGQDPDGAHTAADWRRDGAVEKAIAAMKVRGW